MKKLILLIFFTASSQMLFAQSMGINTLTPDPSAALDIQSNHQGLLVPRVSLKTLTDAQTIPSPAHSLLVYNRNPELPGGTGYYCNAGTQENPNWRGIAFSSASDDQKIAFRADGVVAGQTIYRLSSAKILFGNESYDLANNYNDLPTVHGSTFTAPINGVYHFDVSVYCSPLVLGPTRVLTLFRHRNGSATVILQDKISGSSISGALS